MINAEQKQRIKMLKKIICEIRMMGHGTLASPTIPYISVGMLVGVAVMYIFSIYIYQLDTEWIVSGGLLSGIAGLNFLKYRTWDESVYAKLTEYQPLNQEAYCDLQALAAQKELTQDELLKWASIEWDTINPEKETAVDIARKGFAGKVIES
jgi:hypothetical protein